jgi:hypothetical protein
MTDSDARTKEEAILWKLAVLVICWLILTTLGSIGLAVPILTKLFETVDAVDAVNAPSPYANAWRALLCVLGGTLGSSISALVSAVERVSHGWEFSGGDKYPSAGLEDKFVARMVPFFIVRPFLGSAMGLIVYVGLRSGYLIAVEQAGQATFSRDGLMFLSFLGGLFAKKFIEKLRAMFDTLIGA